MADKNPDAGATAPDTQQLFQWWIGLLPNLLGGATPKAGAGPTDPMLALAQQWFGGLAEGYLRTLVTEPSGDPMHGFEQFMAKQVSGLAERLTGFGQTWAGAMNPGALSANVFGAPLAAFGDALKPLWLGRDRAYGGLADAFGLAPLRELETAGREMAQASLTQRQALQEYLEVVVEALRGGAELLTRRLVELGQRGESIDSMLGLVRMWARTTDEAMHGAMQKPRALELSARLLRASAESRRQQHRVVAIVSEALNVPTRAEVDDAFREIQELKRELRRLRKPVAAALEPAPEAASEAAPEPAPPPVPARSTRRRRTAIA